MSETFESAGVVDTENRFSENELGEVVECMGTTREGDTHNAEITRRRSSLSPKCRWTGDDTAIVFGICVSLLIVLAGTLGYILCVSLLPTLMRVFLPLVDLLKMQVCP